MPLVLIEKVLQESQTVSDYLYLHVQGEPLLHRQFAEVLQLTDRYRRQVQLVTNGILLEDYQDVLLASTSLRKISVSMQGLFLASDLNNKLQVLADFVERAKGHELYIELRVWTAKKSEIIDYIQASFNDGAVLVANAKIKDNLYLSCKTEFEWPTLDLALNSKRRHCLGPKLMICVLSDGTITPCCLDAQGLISLGNIRETTLEEALVSSRYLRMSEGFKDNKAVENLCKHCYYLSGYEEA